MSTGIGTGLRTTFIIVSLGVGLFVTFATVAAFFGTSWWLFDWFANFRWQLMWLAVAASAIYAITSKGLMTFVFLAAAIVNGFLITPLWLGSQPAGSDSAGISVVAVDLYGGAEDSDRTVTWLYDTDADVIIAAGVGSDRLDALLVEGSEYRFLHRPAEGEAGVAIVAKADYATTETGTPTLGEPVLTVNVPSGSGTIDIVTSWGLLANSSENYDALNERLSSISQVVQTSPNETMVIGSLGATRFAHGMRSLMADADLRDATEGKGYLSTWPVSGFPLVGGWIGAPVDVVLMSSGITPYQLQTGPDIGVSHLPVRVIVGNVIGSN